MTTALRSSQHKDSLSSSLLLTSTASTSPSTMSDAAAATPATEAPLQLDAQGVPVVEGKTADQVKAGLDEAIKRSK